VDDRNRNIRISVALWASVALIGGLSLLTHWPYVQAADCANSDACVVVLMARHFAWGEIVPYYWGQRYMASLEPALLAPFAPLGLATLTTGALIALGLTLLSTWLVARLARHVNAPGWLSALVFALPSSFAATHQTVLYGARLAATSLALWALCRACDKTPKQPKDWALTGALLGMALFGDHLMLAFALPCFYAAFRAKALRPALFGCAGFVLLDGVLSFTSASGRHSLPQDPRNLLRGVKLLFEAGLPRILGLDWIDASMRIGASYLWQLAGVLLCFALIALFGLLAQRLSGAERRELPLVLVTASFGAFLVLHVLSALGEESARYLVPSLAPLSVLSAWAASRLGARWGSLLIASLLLPRVISLVTLTPESSRGAACRAEMSALGAALERQGVHAIWADYWDAYRIALAFDERWPVGVPHRANRYPPWVPVAREATPVAYVFSARSPKLASALEAALPEADWQSAGTFRLVKVPRALPGLRGPEPETPGTRER
jgi:hypothetical protein